MPQIVMIAETGDWFIQTKTAATAGQKVFADLSTGEVSTAASGDTVEGAVETEWVVSKGGLTDEKFILHLKESEVRFNYRKDNFLLFLERLFFNRKKRC